MTYAYESLISRKLRGATKLEIEREKLDCVEMKLPWSSWETDEYVWTPIRLYSNIRNSVLILTGGLEVSQLSTRSSVAKLPAD